MGELEVRLERWKRGRHAKRHTTLRTCSGANPFNGLETSGIVNDETKQMGNDEILGPREWSRGTSML